MKDLMTRQGQMSPSSHLEAPTTHSCFGSVSPGTIPVNPLFGRPWITLCSSRERASWQQRVGLPTTTHPTGGNLVFTVPADLLCAPSS